MLYLLPLFAAIAPFIIWPIERLFPYPFFVEELVKAFLVLPLTDLDNFRNKIEFSIVIGLLFTLSESVLYIFNIQEVGNLGVFLVRILLTFPLHTGTVLIMIAFSLKKKLLIIPGLVCAIVIHILFNYFISFI